MWITILNSLRQWWLGIAGSVACGILLFQYAENSYLHRQLRACQSKAMKLQQVLAYQNEAVSVLETESRRRENMAAQLVSEAQNHTREYAAHAEKIMHMKPNNDECADMKRLLNHYGK